MHDAAYRDFFTQPAHTYQRQYEALRAIFVDQWKQVDVAERFGYTYGALRQLVFRFRQFVDGQDESVGPPFFETLLPGATTPAKQPQRTGPSSPTAGD